MSGAIRLMLGLGALAMVTMLVKALLDERQLARAGVSARYRNRVVAADILGGIGALLGCVFVSFQLENYLGWGLFWAGPMSGMLGACLAAYKVWSSTWDEGVDEKDSLFRAASVSAQGDPGRAIEWLRASVQRDPANAVAHYYYACALFAVGDWRAAEAAAQEGLRQRRTARLWRAALLDKMAGALVMLDRETDALAALGQALKLAAHDPDFPAEDVRTKVAELHDGKGKDLRSGNPGRQPGRSARRRRR